MQPAEGDGGGGFPGGPVLGRTTRCGPPCTGSGPRVPWKKGSATIPPPTPSLTPVCSPLGVTTWPISTTVGPLVFIGRSQGAAMLIRLLRGQRIDQNPVLQPAGGLGHHSRRQRPGPKGQRRVGGELPSTSPPAPVRPGQTGCVIAYSSFPGGNRRPTVNSAAGTGVSLQSGQTTTAGQQVLCTNPVNLAGGVGVLDSFFPTHGGRPGPGRGGDHPLRGVLESVHGEVCDGKGGSDLAPGVRGAAPSRAITVPRITETLGPTWGFHLDDVNLALGNLVARRGPPGDRLHGHPALSAGPAHMRSGASIPRRPSPRARTRAVRSASRSRLRRVSSSGARRTGQCS